MEEPLYLTNEMTFEIKSLKQLSTPIRAGISTRNGGVSQEPFRSLNLGLHVNDEIDKVIANRRLFAEENNIPLDRWVCGEQIHGTTIKFVSEDDSGKGAFSVADSILGIDGIITDSDKITLTAFFADCIPLFFFSPTHNLIGLAHAGWKGTVGNISKKMVEAMVLEKGVPVEEIFAVIGPGICQHCYEVDDFIIKKVDQMLPDNSEGKPYKQINDRHYLLDLKELNNQLLKKAGILAKNIEISKYCPSCDNHLFFSHRKEHGTTGRMLAFITLSSTF